MSSSHQRITAWIESDPLRIEILTAAKNLNLQNWHIGAGFVRNLVWDKLHGFNTTQSNDIDLIYYDEDESSAELNLYYEDKLKAVMRGNWSVKNQARMHIRNNHQPYLNISDAISYWPEIETAVAVKYNENNVLEFVAPFGLEHLFSYTITRNSKNCDPDIFNTRVKNKGWLSTWPKLKVIKNAT